MSRLNSAFNLVALSGAPPPERERYSNLLLPIGGVPAFQIDVELGNGGASSLAVSSGQSVSSTLNYFEAGGRGFWTCSGGSGTHSGSVYFILNTPAGVFYTCWFQCMQIADARKYYTITARNKFDLVDVLYQTGYTQSINVIGSFDTPRTAGTSEDIRNGKDEVFTIFQSVKQRSVFKIHSMPDEIQSAFAGLRSHSDVSIAGFPAKEIEVSTQAQDSRFNLTELSFVSKESYQSACGKNLEPDGEVE